MLCRAISKGERCKKELIGFELKRAKKGGEQLCTFHKHYKNKVDYIACLVCDNIISSTTFRKKRCDKCQLKTERVRSMKANFSKRKHLLCIICNKPVSPFYNNFCGDKCKLISYKRSVKRYRDRKNKQKEKTLPYQMAYN